MYIHRVPAAVWAKKRQSQSLNTAQSTDSTPKTSTLSPRHTRETVDIYKHDTINPPSLHTHTHPPIHPTLPHLTHPTHNNKHSPSHLHLHTHTHPPIHPTFPFKFTRISSQPHTTTKYPPRTNYLPPTTPYPVTKITPSPPQPAGPTTAPPTAHQDTLLGR